MDTMVVAVVVVVVVAVAVVAVVAVLAVVVVEVLGGKGTKEGVRAVEVAGAVESEWAVCGSSRLLCRLQVQSRMGPLPWT